MPVPEFLAHHLAFGPGSRGMRPSGDPASDGGLFRWTVRPASPGNSGARTLMEES
ncbi:hypothetical protein ACFYRN_27165 [Streptomyces sp. NPDC005227]|uniref:hypothetical protein n=1 Tax=unclassified Streptomyces TaxID=2593676 RepID=UPI00367BF79A